MNLADTKHAYRSAIEECARSLAAGTVPVERCRAAAVARIDAITRSAKRAIDTHTTRPALSVNTRRGLVAKLEVLHGRAMARLDAVIGGEVVGYDDE
ncbi:hypothetical protein Val02_04230 [Virgisporangium aliadipatigenens]|uniref:Uncharacterized protein n=1 Tax=Virgisporangium aliadipatigenens TaxID=741659 RepID=A0A8J3YFY9_9ACTN|nr:hypothetical protein [Virgisporangium aliadipatigenens]GIJ43537.1 hypothetical protein Val02_04230 [Virgisporangium aliadipatigenens]